MVFFFFFLFLLSTTYPSLPTPSPRSARNLYGAQEANRLGKKCRCWKGFVSSSSILSLSLPISPYLSISLPISPYLSISSPCYFQFINSSIHFSFTSFFPSSLYLPTSYSSHSRTRRCVRPTNSRSRTGRSSSMRGTRAYLRLNRRSKTSRTAPSSVPRRR